jgi:Domain of unknown function (DUF4837)
MNKIFTYSFLLIIVVSIASCKFPQKPASGPEDQIIVFADSLEYEQLKPALSSAFEKIIYTPQPEKLFILKRVNIERLDNYKRKKNVIFVAPLNSESEISKYIYAVIDTNLKAQINADSTVVISKYNLWARDQLVTVLTAPTMNKLIEKIKRQSENLIYTYQKISDKRLYQNLYNSQYEQKKIEAKFLKKYGWIIYVQADFQVSKDDSVNNFVWIRRSPNSDMERWIFIHWIDNASLAYLNEDSIKAVRDEVTKKFYRTTDGKGYVVIAKDYFTSSEINFNGRYTILTQGLWELNIKGMGGPFINYTFYDEKSKRIYMIDGSVYAPKYFKRNLIQQMDVTIQSFLTKDELSNDRQEDLLDALD